MTGTERAGVVALLLLVSLVGGVACGVGGSVQRYYDACMDNWTEMIAFAKRDADEVRRWGDWPGRNQCFHEVDRTWGAIGRAFVPSPGPNPHPEEDIP